MTRHRFRVGQMVHYNAGRLGNPASARAYSIVRLLPPEGTELLYRIKATSEVYERVAKESELALR